MFLPVLAKKPRANHSWSVYREKEPQTSELRRLEGTTEVSSTHEQRQQHPEKIRPLMLKTAFTSTAADADTGSSAQHSLLARHYAEPITWTSFYIYL